MSFEGAKTCFAENIQRSLALKESDPMKAITWNLNKGLLDLVNDLEERLNALDAAIHRQSR